MRHSSAGGLRTAIRRAKPREKAKLRDGQGFSPQRPRPSTE